MKVLIKEPGRRAEVRDVENTLEAMQEIVGGNIEAIRLNADIVIWCNEEGKLLSLAPNFMVHVPDGDMIRGTVVATRVDEDGDCTNLTDADVRVLSVYFTAVAAEEWLHYGREAEV